MEDEKEVLEGSIPETVEGDELAGHWDTPSVTVEEFEANKEKYVEYFKSIGINILKD